MRFAVDKKGLCDGGSIQDGKESRIRSTSYESEECVEMLKAEVRPSSGLQLNRAGPRNDLMAAGHLDNQRLAQARDFTHARKQLNTYLLGVYIALGSHKTFTIIPM